MSNLKGETRLILERQRLAVALRTSPERRSSGAAVILCTDVGRTELGNHSVVIFAQLLGLMCYSWSSSFWLQRLIFNHHTNDVFSEALLIVFSSLVCLRVCCVAVFVCVSVLKKEFTCISDFLLCNMCVNSCINKRWHKKCCWCHVFTGVWVGCFVEKKKKRQKALITHGCWRPVGLPAGSAHYRQQYPLSVHACGCVCACVCLQVL